MNIWSKFVFFNFIFCVSESVCEIVWTLGGGQDYNEDMKNEVENSGGDLSWTVNKTVKRYYCTCKDEYKGDSIPVYGTNAWKFPVQDVNLTLIYPMPDVPTSKPDSYIISTEVILYFDGKESFGFITDGGILKDHISMTFVLPNITELAYKFTVHTILKTQLHQGFISDENNFALC